MLRGPGLAPRSLILAMDMAFVLAAFGGPAAAYWMFGDELAEPRGEGVPLPDLAVVRAACAPLENGLLKNECYLDPLRTVLYSHGVGVAFRLLIQLANEDSYAGAVSHPLAHALGRDAVVAYKDPVPALVECPTGLASGCLHGVLESYLESHPETQGEGIQRLCRDLAPDGSKWFQCLHGIGHGVTMSHGHDIYPALERCTDLATAFEEEACYSGVFMENAVSWGVANGILVGESEFHVHESADGKRHNGTLRRDDLQYPCNAVEEKFVGICYTFQTSVYLLLNGYNLPAAADACLWAPEKHQQTCFFSLGRDVSAISQWTPAKAAELCEYAVDTYEPYCIAGVVKDFINQWAKPELGLQLCGYVKPMNKQLCYHSFGEILFAVFPFEAAVRSDACAKSEAEYVATCRTTARL